MTIHYGDPIYTGPPTQERIIEIKKRFYWDEWSKYGYPGRLYFDGKPYLKPMYDKLCQS